MGIACLYIIQKNVCFLKMLAFVQALWEREGEPVRTDAIQFNLSIFNSTMRFLRSNLGRRH